jgi:NADH-ubiquinone oxidoreductase chain 3
MLIFFLALTLGFAFELGKNALKIDSRQMLILTSKQSNTTTYLSGININFSLLRKIFKKY